jgi:4-hydroxy-tetrahydrodipicolinate reductase
MKLMVNGLPGNMAQTVLSAALRRGVEVIPYSLTGADVAQTTMNHENMEFALVSPEGRDREIENIREEWGPFISVDYTHPSAVNDNAAFYISHDLPFVMGTTGGDREKLCRETDAAGLYAVIAPNMAKQIVALQYMLTHMAETFPDLYAGYTLSVVESHQKTKADTSGTARAIVDSFNKMGVEPFSASDITMIRDDGESQRRLNVPAEYVSGHAFHTYRVESLDKTVAFEYRHNVCGRSVYGEGTIDAAQFLWKKIEEKSTQKRFSMIDVLTAGSMQ